MNYIIVANKKPIVIGRQGENEVTTVRFSINALFPDFANADFGLVHQRHGDVAPYPCVINNINGFIEWVVGSGDLANVGSGTAQLSAYKDGLVEKTEIFTTVTLDSMGMTDPPEATQAWVDELLQAGFRAESAADTAEGAAEDAQEILDNIGTTVSNALAEAKASGDFDGPQGDPGFSPTVSVTSITGGHRVSITDEDATNTFDVMDGDKGDDGVSPTITSEAIAGGHRLTIVDADGTTTVDVMDGEDGAAATVSVGTTTTLSPGSDATVTNSGTFSAAVLNFGIPKGDKGDTGDAGVYYGTTEPTDPNVTVWIDPSGSADNYIVAPASPTTGQFLKWSGTAWVASDLPVYNGGVS